MIYIVPQVWAWRPGRTYTVAEVATKVLVIFEFEVAPFREAGADVEFVGHPLLDEIDLDAPKGAARKTLGIGPETPLLAIMPGSRRQVRKRLLPVFLEVERAVRAVRPEVAAAIGTPDGTHGEFMEDAPDLPPAVRRHDLLRDATAGMFNSGTMSLEAAILGCPGVICYRTNWLNYQVAKRVVSLTRIGLPNIVLGGDAMRELIQGDLRASVAAAEMLDLVADPARREAASLKLKEVREKLGPPGASGRAAEAILKLL